MRDAKKIILVCEGERREYDYFKNFQGFDSRIQIEIVAPNDGDDNSPVGLFKTALKKFTSSVDGASNQGDFQEGDELWFIIDTDKWGDKIDLLREGCEKLAGWEVAQSNPCFEVWLYYHFHPRPSSEVGFEIAKTWKQLLNNDVTGGFESRKHYLLISTAILNASMSYRESNGKPLVASTAVFKPASSIYNIARLKLESMLQQALE